MKSTLIAFALFTAASTSFIAAHCQIPCGIYADDNVYAGMLKDQETIEKAMQQITDLSKDPTTHANQISRWVTNKEQHAQSIQDTVAQYYLAQRVKLGEKDKEAYLKKLTHLHEITVYAMKCKQTTNLENAKKLREALENFQALYSPKKATKKTHSHSHDHGHPHSHGH